MTGDAILALDGGGTRTRAAVFTRDGACAASAEAGPSNDLQVGSGAALASLHDAIEQAIDASGVARARIAAVAAGLAGVDYDGTGAGAWVRAFRQMGFARAFVYGDMVAAHRGALGWQPGVVVIAGTGSVTLGVGTDGTMVKVGGWGPIYGNEGSAYAIGRDGLAAAARAHDGRGSRTRLVESLRVQLGVADFQRSIDAVYAGPMGQHDVAALAPLVYDAAMAGDAVADEICTTAAGHLADGVRTALLRLGDSSGLPVSYQGAVLCACDLIRARFEADVRRMHGGIVIEPPRHEPVAGAFLLGSRALGWNVASPVALAGGAAGTEAP